MSEPVKKILPFVLGLVCLAVFIGLGRWQLQREAYKRALQNQADSALHALPREVAHIAALDTLEGMPVRLVGTWQIDKTFFLDNRVHSKLPGYHVITPLKLSTGEYVLVNRGWIQGDPDRKILPAVRTNLNVLPVIGVVHPPYEKGFSLGDSLREERIWQRVNVDRARAWVGSKHVAPWLVFEQGGEQDGLVRVDPEMDFGADVHRAYAMQWFGLALAAFCYLVYGVRRSWMPRASAAPQD